uniref:Uncharacterized protein n=1 Tax=Picea sitchensis TaxID=3332 RepID=A9NTG7_PICSI|nr:unknown [Picea sitchensis]
MEFLFPGKPKEAAAPGAISVARSRKSSPFAGRPSTPNTGSSLSEIRASHVPSPRLQPHLSCLHFRCGQGISQNP